MNNNFRSRESESLLITLTKKKGGKKIPALGKIGPTFISYHNIGVDKSSKTVLVISMTAVSTFELARF